ncbi:unnamed protein product, partial [Mesorhabditis belari]|uniref:Cyclin N-terminal domain-containing protein n=1 Tax=Mesorhabditis belari TaxID=2138241 RepID=A0AAF3F687_9BILA
MGGITQQKANAGAAVRKLATDREIEGLTSKLRRLSLDDPESERAALVQSISSKIRSARRSARRSLGSFPTCHVEKDDLVRIKEALFQAHLTSDESALSVNQTEKKLEDLVARIDENELAQCCSRAGLPLELADVGGKDYAFDIINYSLHNQMPCENVASQFPEIKRARMVDWIFCISRVVRVPDESYFLAVHLLDKALLVDKNISEMSDVENRVVMLAAVRLAGRVEFGPEYENEMCNRLKSVVCNLKLQCEEDKIKQWESQLLNFFDFGISRKHLLHFLRMFWLLMGDFMSGTEKKKNGPRKPSLVAAAIMRIGLHLFFNRGQLPEDKFPRVISSLLHKESEYVPIATNLLNWVLSVEHTFQRSLVCLKPINIIPVNKS